MMTHGTWRITFTWPFNGQDVPPIHMDVEFPEIQDSIDEILSTFIGSRIIHVRPKD